MNAPALAHRLTSVADLRRTYDEPSSIVQKKVATSLDRHAAGFLHAARLVVVNLTGSDGATVPILAGGEPGFARIEDSTSLAFDLPSTAWPGHDPLAGGGSHPVGLLFIVPGVKEVLRIKGSADIALSQADGARVRLGLRIQTVFFHCAKALMRSGVWDPPKPAGVWKGLRDFTCVRKVSESAVITSFHFAPIDGGEVPRFRPGQHVPVEVTLPGREDPIRRVYSLSNRPGEGVLRISVKREADPALASGFLHDAVEVGSVIRLRPPGGQFHLDETSRRPVVLLSAGVGVTPMVAMLEHLAAQGASRRVWFFHAATSGREHAFGARVREIARDFGNARVHVTYARPRPDQDRIGHHHDSEGRLSVELLKTILPWDDYEFYVCGPKPFMSGVIGDLFASGVRPDRVRWETFSGEKLDVAAPEAPLSGTQGAPVPARIAATVTFKRSGKTAMWKAGCGSLLDLAEKAGIETRSSCRTGECFSCVTRILSGRVDYDHELDDIPDQGTVLLCSAMPKGDVILDI